ncbi:MAG: hypothetical protein IT324_24310 [Anaerolineae bacterium]|nr:hypothetical protein [Anaerolineae bacterium]
MKHVLAPPELGQHILLVMDNCPACLEMLRIVIAHIPAVTQKAFMLLHCCPTIYWEHGGGPSPEVQHAIEAAEDEEAKEFTLTEQYFEQASAILQHSGVPKSQIHSRVALEDDLLDAVLAELRQRQYSGVIIGSQHHDIANRLHSLSLTEWFKGVPALAVWELGVETLAQEAKA